MLILARFLVNIFWNRGMDPDTCAIPLLTSLGDLLGTVFLLSVFYMLRSMGDITAFPAENSDPSLVSSALAADIQHQAMGDILYKAVDSLVTSQNTVTVTSTIAPNIMTQSSTTTLASIALNQATNFVTQIASS